MRKIERPFCAYCKKVRCEKGRKFCGELCRQMARQSQEVSPTPEEIARICREIREAGGDQWEQTRTCYPPQHVEIPVWPATNWDTTAPH
jgi:hypothetical protein